MARGKYIVLEGPAGVGKTTQLAELAKKMRSSGLEVMTFKEPDKDSDLISSTISQLANDRLYPKNIRTAVLLYNASRSQLLEIIKANCEKGIHCIVERNFLSTLAIQFYGKGNQLDYYTINKIIDFAVANMEPDLTMVLDAPIMTLKARLNEYLQNDYDEEFLERVRAGYLWEANQRHYPVIFADQPKNFVADEVWKLANQTLASRNGASTASVQSVGQIIESKIASAQIGDASEIAEGQEQLNDVVSNPGGNVHVVKPEFNNTAGDVISEALIGQRLVVENASSLLAAKLERGRLATYTEQLINYEEKDASGHYKYYLPPEFKSATLKMYTKIMDKIFDLYLDLSRELTDYIRANDKTPKKSRDDSWQTTTRVRASEALRAVLPIAAKTTVGIFASGEVLESLITRLLADELPEANSIGKQILDEAKKVISLFLDSPDKSEYAADTITCKASTYKSVRKLADNYLPPSHTNVTTNGAELTDINPRNELDIIADILYEHSDTPLAELRKLAANWSYDKKVNILKTYCGERQNPRQRPGRALEKIHYSWDIVCEYEIFKDLLRHRMVDDLNWQALTPRYGYDIPQLVEDAGLTDKFEQCFDLSLKLYSQLQAAGFPLEAQYATLHGHRMRCKLTYNAREAFHLHELRASAQGQPAYRKLVKQMHNQLAEIHPLLAEAMKSVNQVDNPKLAKLDKGSSRD